MAWERELAELRRRQELALAMGGADAIKRQHEAGKRTARERIDLLADPGSFREFGMLAGAGTYDGDELVTFTPKGEVHGMCRIDGRPAVVSAGDFTVRGGAATRGSGGLGTEMGANRRALEWRVPYVRLLDASGGSVSSFEEIGRTYLPDGNIWSWVDVDLLQTVPVASAVMGSVAGLPAVNACLSHFNVMVRGTAQLFPGGPPVVKAALGVESLKTSWAVLISIPPSAASSTTPPTASRKPSSSCGRFSPTCQQAWTCRPPAGRPSLPAPTPWCCAR